MNNYDKYYGLNPMSFQEEVDAPESVRNLRTIKITSIDRLSTIVNTSFALMDRVRRIHEDEQDEHILELISELEKSIHKAKYILFEAMYIGKGERK